MRLLACVFITVFYQFNFAQNTVYVSTSGNDNDGNGSIGNPYGTIQYAVNQCSEGDTLEIRGGKYTISSTVRIDVSDLTIRSYANEWAILSATYNNEEIDELFWFRNPDMDGGLLERLELSGGYYYVLKFESNWDWGEEYRRGVSNITLKNCRIHDSGRDCIKITPGCNNLIFESCEIFNSGMRCTDPDDCNAEGIDCVNGSNIVVRNCYIHNTGTNGIYLKGGAKNGLIESNLVSECGSGGILLGFYTDEEWFDAEENPDLYENINGIVRNNIIAGTESDGIGLYAAYQPKVYNNTVVDAARDIHAALFINTGYIWVEALQDMYAPPCVDVDVRNNIFMSSGTGGNPAGQIRYYEDDIASNIQGDCVIDNNIYYNTVGTSFNDGISEHELTLEQWQAATGFDENSVDANPELDASYHLTDASTVAIDEGDNLVSVLVDYDGQERTDDIDIGADEHNNGAALSVPPAGGIVGTGGEAQYIPVSGYRQQTYSGEGVSISPLPVISQLHLSYLHPFSWEIYGLSGKVIASGDCNGQTAISVSYLTRGIYFIRIISDTQNVLRQFIKL